MRVADDVLSIGGQKTVLAVLQTCPLVRTAIEISQHRIPPTQYEECVSASPVGIEPPRDPGRQFIQPTQTDLGHRIPGLLRTAAREPLVPTREQKQL
jgi:hypothetical protein